ncbi:VOC family protein [Fulvivirga kasyanovii]|uniref:VOC family protein n=1 Tax=Fulvivirga kasyanovii TaxID=396812 RepID=A0ABW9RQ18_9BACT|nr:VOC family protein [Fulvivirga kasyanovii]MTI25842.1 VOC family protein [Fulvivirga kasyanovii]
MSKLITYLTFNGNCREAMKFYQNCFGGELYLQTIGDTPEAEKLPANLRNYVLHASLDRNDLILMGTDMVEEKGLVKGNAMSIMVECSDEMEVRKYYDKLSEGGVATHPLKPNFFGNLFGGLQDKFGNHWLLHTK